MLQSSKQIPRVIITRCFKLQIQEIIIVSFLTLIPNVRFHHLINLITQVSLLGMTVKQQLLILFTSVWWQMLTQRHTIYSASHIPTLAITFLFMILL